MTPVFNHFATCLIVAPLALLPMSLCAQEVPSDTQTVDQAGTFPEYNAKLLLTNAVSAVDGASGGGISNWATIAGRQETRGVGVQAHVTAVLLPDFFYQSHGVALGIADRIELSYARQNFDTQDVGAALGIGQGYMLNQDVFGAKVRLFGDVVYGNTMVPQVAVGAQYKRSLDGAVASAVGAAHDEGIDVTLSATKLFLSQILIH